MKSICIIVLIHLILITNSANAQYESLTHNGLNRTYLIHLPENYTQNEALPLIIAMHGGFGNAYNLQNQSQLSETADMENFIVVYPEGIAGGILNIPTWNAGWCCGYASSSNIDDVGFINTLLDTLISQYDIDTNRIYATGMSNGGFMAYRLACELSHRIAAIAPVAASLAFSDCTPTRPVPIISFHSYLDSNVPYHGGIGDGFSSHYNSPQDSIMSKWASINGCSTFNDTIVNNEEYTHVQWSNCECNVEVHQYITQDGGHSWPGGNQTPTGDPTSNYINANDKMWAFFQQHTLNCSSTTGIQENAVKEVPFEIYPNPTTETFNILPLNNRSDKKITIYDSFGNFLMESKNHSSISLANYPSGIYYITISSNKITFTKKLLLTH
ncbi:MAG: T9SS type A sorting domain-containing protein [Chitinophagales bacterium]